MRTRACIARLMAARLAGPRLSPGSCLALLPVAMIATGFVTPCVSAETQGVISTASARFERIAWSALPGWEEEAHADVLRVFARACQRLQSRPLWQAPCRELAAAGGAAVTDGVGTEARIEARIEAERAARAFFESRFTAYRVADRAPSLARIGAAGRETGDEGLLTGYFEPILSGRRQRGGRFIHPVYGTPPSMLYLDARMAGARPGSGRLDAVIRGRQVIPASEGRRPGEPVYPVVLDSLQGEPLDRRYRLRLDGGRLVAYPDRAGIEASSRPIGPVLAWVDDPGALYVMQVQGSGRVRFADGRELRLAYADQNGQPFTPRGAATPSRTRSVTSADAPAALSGPLRALIDGDPGGKPGSGSPGGPAGPGDAGPGVGSGGSRTRSVVVSSGDREVERVIQQLLSSRAGMQASGPEGHSPIAVPPPGPGAGPGAEARPGQSPVAPTSTTGRSGLGRDGRIGTGASPPFERAGDPRLAATALAFLARARRLDRSYVFFRAREDREAGPPGALGVALTAGRSIAVDPRVTPLGAPVYIAAARQGSDSPIHRLTIAQDTGGAIRGAVRADFFWGSGPGAGRQALMTRDVLAMWVLLPRGFLESRRPASRTRSVDASQVDCTAPDPDYCDESQ